MADNESPFASPAELVQTMLDLTPSEVFELDRIEPDGTTKTWQVRVCMLRLEVERQGMIAAQKYARAHGENPTENGDLYREEQAVEIVVRSVCHVDEETRPDGTRFYRRWFVNADQVRASLTSNELAALLNFYQVVKSKFGHLYALDDISIEQWVSRLGDELMGPYFLSRLDSAHWGDAVLAVARWAREQAEIHGHPLPSLQPTSASDPSISDPGTGSSGPLPGARLKDKPSPSIPSDRSLTQPEAARLSEELFGPKQPPDLPKAPPKKK